MDRTVSLLIGGLAGLISFAITSMLAYRNLSRVRASLTSSIERAERELNQDVERIGVDELQHTNAGRELLTRLKLSDEETIEKLLILKEQIQLQIGLRRGDTEIVKKLLILREQIEWLLEQHPAMEKGMLGHMKASQKVLAMLRERLADPLISPTEKYELERRSAQTKEELEGVQRQLLTEGK